MTVDTDRSELVCRSVVSVVSDFFASIEGVLGRLFGGSHPVVYAWGRSMRWCQCFGFSLVSVVRLGPFGHSSTPIRRRAGLGLCAVVFFSLACSGLGGTVPVYGRLCSLLSARPLRLASMGRTHARYCRGSSHSFVKGPLGATKHIGTEPSAGAPYSEHHSNTSLQRRLGRQTLADCPENTYFPGAE